MQSTIEPATLARIWGFRDGHIPAVHAHPWIELIPTDAEANMISSSLPVPVWGSCNLPATYRAMPPGDQARLAAYATIGTIELHRPRFNRVLIGGRMVETSGTTVMVTARDGASIMGVPLSAGESYFAVMRRIQDRIENGHPRLGPSDLTLAHAYLPVWAAVVSIVPQDRPMANLMGSGGACPTEVCIGRESVNFVSEHRLFTPDDGFRFTSTWMELLDASLAHL